jgi:hypothetical protein
MMMMLMLVVQRRKTVLVGCIRIKGITATTLWIRSSDIDMIVATVVVVVVVVVDVTRGVGIGEYIPHEGKITIIPLFPTSSTPFQQHAFHDRGIVGTHTSCRRTYRLQR